LVTYRKKKMEIEILFLVKKLGFEKVGNFVFKEVFYGEKCKIDIRI